jgi:hypothetical protein
MALADASPHRAQHSASIPCQPQETITPPQRRVLGHPVRLLCGKIARRDSTVQSRRESPYATFQGDGG